MCQCHCEKGFKGELCFDFNVPDSMNNCSSTPEDARAGPALEKDGEYVCNCLWGYSGIKCEVHGCEKSDCNNHGSCPRGAEECSCNDGWEGLECERKTCVTNKKNDLECYGPKQGVCNNGTCTCFDGWTGNDCGTNACGPAKDCSGNGVCSKTTHVCVCKSGWDGAFCAEKKCPVGQTINGLEQCSEHGPCNRGTCLCDCLSKDDCWLGDACEQPACPGKTTEGIDCSGHGECAMDDVTSKFQCGCEAGYYGDDCSVTCPGDCSGHGKCGAEGECTCELGWLGLSCARTCAGKCLHEGVCNLKTGICDKCDGKWSGDLCEESKCDPLCHPAGTENCFAAKKSNGLGKCICKDGWIGETCEEELCPDCYGKCTDGTCQCGPNVRGYERHHGVGCSLVDCVDNLCAGHGVCNIYANATSNGGSLAGTCSCTFGFGGVSCERLACEMGGKEDEKRECTGDEFGMCVNGKCECKDGFGGNACERKECVQINGKECNGEGICLPDGTCHCAAEHDDMENLLGGWSGDACQISYCGAGAGAASGGLGCSGHGKCEAGDASLTGGLPTCKCADGWDSDNCQRKKCPLYNEVECGGNFRGLCENHAVVLNTTLDEPQQFEMVANCVCSDGFIGDDCGSMECLEFEGAQVCNAQGDCDRQEDSITKGTCINCAVGYAGAFCHLPTAIETEAEDDVVEKANNQTYVNLIKQAETKAEEVVAEDPGDFALKAAKVKLAKQQAEATALKEAAGELKEEKQGILNNIDGMMANLKSVNKTARKLDPTIAKKETPNKCITHPQDGTRPQVCGGHGACSASKDKCACEDGWGSQWSATSGSQPDDPLCESESCPDECSRSGRCIRGVCYCEPGFSGLNCANVVCGDVCVGEHEYPIQEKGKCVCQCTFGWKGKGCATKIMSSCPDDCGEHGTCDKGACNCLSDWSGEFCEIPPCPTELKGISCTGRGTCLETQKCECAEMYTGQACELLSCVHLDGCGGHGVCNNGTCACGTGWGGTNCTTEVFPECPLGCSGVGECTKGQCFCPPGYYGDGCQKTYNMCTPENCNGHGACNITECLCYPSWKGDACDVEIKSCPDQCTNEEQGTCDTVTGMCSCHEGWTGLTCSAKLCPKGCGHGTCNNGTCACDPSWEGPMCLERTCPDGCNGHGTCEIDFSGTTPPFCKCEADFSGSACEITAGGCMVDMGKGRDPEQCAGHGYCETNNFCSCFVGWDPNSDCKEQLCDPADCSGHGVCQDSGKCDCHNGWLGSGCDTKACPRSTRGDLCSGHGMCNDETKECGCVAGWCGDNCGEMKKIDFPQGCMSMDADNDVMCSGHGACRQLPSPPGGLPRGTCDCDDRWGGPDCAVARCVDDCSGHGKCDELLTCQCDVGFAGEGCKDKTCEEKGCVNGECDSKDGFCKCHVRWTGEDCNEELCPNNCNGHGTCDNDVTCQCVEGYTGVGCADAPGCVDECGKGQCLPLEGGGGKCKCPLGLDGLACEVELCPGTLTDAGSCFGHGECSVVGDEGLCECDKVHGWLGLTCEKSRCPKGCSGNGLCNEDGSCLCSVGFIGKDCSKIGCAHGFRNANGEETPCTEQYCSSNTPNDVTCGGKGKCDETEQKCLCEKGFWGVGCQESLCTPTCENGQCRKLDNAQRGVCVCDSGFSGTGCNIAYCGKDSKCHDHGQCNHKTQTCDCGNGYRGKECKEEYCGKDGTCSGHGSCDFKLETCKCTAGWSGDFCIAPSCGPNGDCSGHGICLQEGDTASCDCMDGFEETDCSIKIDAVVSKEVKEMKKEEEKIFEQVTGNGGTKKTAKIEMEKAVEKAATAAAKTAYEKISANGGTKEEAELAAKATKQEVKAGAGEAPAAPPSSSVSLSVPLVLRGSAGDQEGVLTDIFQGMFKDGMVPTGGQKLPMYELASQVNNIAIEVCKGATAKTSSDAACAPRLSIPLQYAVSDMAREWCVKTPEGKCDVHTVSVERIQSIVQDVESAQGLLSSETSSFDQIKAAILARKLYDALEVSPTFGNKEVTDATMTITEHYPERFAESVTVIEHAATLIQELSALDAIDNGIDTSKLSKERLLTKCEIATHALLQSNGKISPARGLLEQALIMHSVQGLSTFEWKQAILVHLSKGTMTLADISTGKPIDTETKKAFECLSRALLTLAKTSAKLQKHELNVDDIDIAENGLHNMAVELSGVPSGPVVAEKLISLCLADELQGHEGPMAQAMALVTPVAAAKKLNKEGIKVTPEKLKKMEAAFVGSTSNAIAHAIATAGGKCANDW